MASKSDYRNLALSFKRDLDGLAFKSYRRVELTERLRELSGEGRARISTSKVADDIDDAFHSQGLRIFPRLQDMDTDDLVRVWRAGTRAEMLDLLLLPGKSSDRELGNITKKIKGPWNWTDPEGGIGAK